MKRARVFAAVAGVLASLAPAAPAAALSPPELFVRLQPWNTHEPVGDWIPLASAPALDYLAGYDIGYRLQASGQPNEFQRVALSITAVPDGQPTQPYNAEPFCVGRAGAPGDIVDAGPELQFEGDGTYTVTVSVGPGTQPTDCLSGPSTTASFTVTTRVAPVVFGDLVRFRLKPLAGNPFVGIRAPAPPGGQGEVRCALNGTVQPDGSVAGSAVLPAAGDSNEELTESAFPRPGAWLCVTRGTAEGVDANFDSITLGTPWSAPVAVPVLSDFRRYPAALTRPRTAHPVLNVKAEWPGLAAGGRVTVTLRRVTGCRGRKYKLRKVGTFRGSFSAGRLHLKLSRPRAAGFYLGAFSFGGAQFLRPGTDPFPMLMAVRRRFLEFSTTAEFPRCPLPRGQRI